MAKKKRIKNSSGSNKIIRGRLVTPGQYIDVPDRELELFLEDSGITDAINNGDLIMNNGTADISGVTENIRFFNFKGDADVIMFDTTGTTITSDNVCDALKEIAIYGSEYQNVESDVEMSASTAGYTEKLKLTTTSLVGGNYRIEWYFELNHNSTSSTTQAKVEINDTTIVSSPAFRPQYPTDYVTNSGHKVINLAAGVHTVDIDFGPETTGVSNMRNARIELYRVS